MWMTMKSFQALKNKYTVGHLTLLKERGLKSQFPSYGYQHQCPLMPPGMMPVARVYQKLSFDTACLILGSVVGSTVGTLDEPESSLP